MHYKKSRFDISLFAMILTFTLCAVFFFHAVDIPAFLSKATEYSAAVVLPIGEESSISSPESTLPVTSSVQNVEAVDTSGEITAIESTSSSALTDGLYPVIEETRLDSGDIVENDGIKVINKTSLSPQIDIAGLKESFCAKKGTVLIYHTHASEAYAENYTGSYDPNRTIYSDDGKETVIAAGRALKEALESVGISVIHDTTVFDNPSNSGAYMRAKTHLEALLTENPDITYMIDIHRGVIQQTGGARIKPTVKVGENKAAQLSIITGCDLSGNLKLPNWEKNLAFALNLQESLNERSPLISRPVSLEERNYNFDMCENSLCIEIGTDTSTVAEAELSARILGECLSSIILK